MRSGGCREAESVLNETRADHSNEEIVMNNDVYRVVDAILDRDPVREHHYQYNPVYHALVFRDACDIVVIAATSAKMKEAK